MNFRGRQVALYGRFLTHSRDYAVTELARLGGVASRDLTRRSYLLVIGQGALSLVPSGHLLRQVRRAVDLGVPVIGETRFWSVIHGIDGPKPTFPVRQITPPPRDGLLELLNAFDLIVFDGENCRFGDVSVLRDTSNLIETGHEVSSAIRLTLRAQQVAPKGRHKLTISEGDSARLLWEDGETELDGQGFLSLPDQPTLDEVFEHAMLAEAEGDLESAARYYEVCAQMDRKDALAPFNLGNVLRLLNRRADARDRFSQAIARDPKFAEAYYNRALLAEACKDAEAAILDYRIALSIDAQFRDAMFNLAQLLSSEGQVSEAARWFDKFIELCSDPDELRTARRAKRAALSSNSRT